MRHKANENGYALLLVIMLMLLFTTLGMGLLSMNINAAKQFNLKEENILALHQAEMGVLHYKAELEKIIKENKKKLILPCSTFKYPVDGVSEDGLGGYKITEADIKCESLPEIYSITIDSTGDYSSREKTIEAKFNINKVIPTKIEDGKIPDPSDYEDVVQLVIGNLSILNGLFTPVESSLQITGNLLGQNGNSLGGTNLLVQNNLFIKDKVEFKNHACIVVRDNLISEGDITSVAQVYIYVYGDAYITSGTYNLFNTINQKLFVTGDVYKDGVKMSLHKFQPVPSGNSYTESGKTCSLPGSGNPTPLSPDWTLGNKMKVNYFK